MKLVRLKATTASLTVKFRAQPRAVQAIWAVLALEFVVALIEARWPLAAIAATTFALTLIPTTLSSRLNISLPTPFLAGITIFIFMTIFLGEAFDFYNKYWWWDVALHGGSALGFGLLGFLFAFVLFEGDRFAAPAWALGLIGCTLGVTIGVVWEIFEFAMDQSFGTNMQKSGLVDTMWDLIVDVIGAGLGGLAGALWLKKSGPGMTRRLFEDFIERNRRFFKKFTR